ALGGKSDNDFRANAQLRFEGECAPVKINEAFCDRQSKTGSLLRRFDGVRSLAEGGEHDRYFLLGDTRTGVLHADVLAPGSGPAHLEPDLPPMRRELDRVAQEIEADLPHPPCVCP